MLCNALPIFNYTENRNMTPTDLELLIRLETLVAAARKEVSEYKDKYGYNAISYKRYRNLCFSLIDKPFWEIANRMDCKPVFYDKGHGYEEAMACYVEACYAHREGGWLNNVLKVVGLQVTMEGLYQHTHPIRTDTEHDSHV